MFFRLKKIALATVFAALASGFAFGADLFSPEKSEPAPAAVADSRTDSAVRALAPFERFSRDAALPETASDPAKSVVAWRGETVVFRFGVFAGKRALKNPVRGGKISFVSENGAKISADVSPVRWTVGQGGAQFADVVDFAGADADVLSGTLREFLVSVKIPFDAAPGIYRGSVSVKMGSATEKTAFAVRVVSAQIPPPGKRAVHLDLWQHPQAVARWAGVKPWTKAHFDALTPLMTRLRDLGQKVITCSIIEEPWNHQTYDDWNSMVRWTRKRDGSWAFDYSAFDAWVSFMTEKIGIAEQISCYSMLPWTMKISYFDEAEKTQKTFPLDIASPSFDEVWGAFLSDFKKHLAKKGWLEKTCIALDERPDAQIDAARKTLARHAPELGIVSANDHPTRMSDFVRDISPVFQHSGGDIPALAAQRRREGKKTTFYVCVNPARPNTFTHSAPAEARWLGLYAAANGFDGILRWAYNSWNENPFATTAFGNWPAGDCFLVYPGNRSSMRLENFRDGLEDFEKILVLRERASAKNASPKLKAAVAALDDYLKKTFTVAAGGGSDHTAQVSRALALIDDATRFLKN